MCCEVDGWRHIMKTILILYIFNGAATVEEEYILFVPYVVLLLLNRIFFSELSSPYSKDATL